MTSAEKSRIMFNGGMAASRKPFNVMGVLRLEIVQSASQAEKLMAELGSEVYITLAERNQASVSRDTPSVRRILLEIEQLHAQSGSKENGYLPTPGKQETTLDALEWL